MASSGNYISEPPTSGKVLLKTSAGEIHIELWTKEAPVSCRNFFQLCLEGYYSGSIFHRVIPGFLVQTGDPTGTGTGGESVYGGGFKDEFHSRLKFNHRGVVAWANSRRNDNRSQFFITLDKTPWLEQKHTIFGKVTGNSVYTIGKLAECEIGKDDRPLDPPRILSAEVLANPFLDIVPRSVEQPTIEVESPSPPQIHRKKPVSKSLLSFEEDLQEVSNVKILSSHDALNDAQLLKETDPTISEPNVKVQETDQTQELKRRVATKQSKDSESEEEPDQDFDRLMKKRVLDQRAQFSMTNPRALLIETTEMGPYTIEDDQISHKLKVTKPSEDEEFDTFQSSVLRMKQNKTGSNSEMVRQSVREEEEMLSPLELRRYKFYQKQKKTKGTELDTINKLNSFIEKVQQHSKPREEQTEEERELWFNNRLKFSVDSTKAYAFSKAEEDKKRKVAQEVTDLDPVQRMKRMNEDGNRYGTSELREMLSLEHLDRITSERKQDSD